MAADVVLYHAADCHLCERALRTARELRSELEFSLREVDVTGDPELEARYRELLPVVEIEGEQAFIYHIDKAAFRGKVLAQAGPREERL